MVFFGFSESKQTPQHLDIYQIVPSTNISQHYGQ